MRSVTRILFSLCVGSGGSLEADGFEELIQIINDALVVLVAPSEGAIMAAP